MFSKSKFSKYMKVFFYAVSSVFLLLVFILTVLVWLRSWSPFMDDGPFHGQICEKIPEGEPDQLFPIWDGMRLKVYNRTDSRKAPIVLLQNSGGEKLWAVYATALNVGDVEKIQFYKYRKFPFKTPRVRGQVYWTYGNEGTWWFISRAGDLKEYWYSW